MTNSFQDRCVTWATQCFGIERVTSLVERHYRFFEEAIELVQSTGLSEATALKMVKHVYSRNEGASFQELGGTIITLSVLASALQVSLDEAGEVELARCHQRILAIREKNLRKTFQPVLTKEES